MKKKEKFEAFYRDLIVDVAEKLFAKDGYDAVTMEEIAAKSECSKSTLYSYYKSKDEVFSGIILKGLGMMSGILKEVAKSEKPFAERFFDFCFAVSDFQNAYPIRFEGVAGNVEINPESPNFEHLIKSIFVAGEEINATIASFLNDGCINGVLNPSLPMPQSVFAFWGALLGIVRIGGQDEKLIYKRMNVSKREFLKNSFEVLLKGFA